MEWHIWTEAQWIPEQNVLRETYLEDLAKFLTTSLGLNQPVHYWAVDLKNAPALGAGVTCQGSQALPTQPLPGFIGWEVLLWALLSPEASHGFESGLPSWHSLFSTVRGLSSALRDCPRTWVPPSLSRSWAFVASLTCRLSAVVWTLNL